MSSWNYPRATITNIHDGDTVTADVDLGFDTTRTANVRLLGCNAIELSKPGGKEAQANLAGIMPIGTVIALRSVKWDKYGDRVDGAITLPNGQDLVTLLINTGWAAAWDGVGTAPIPAWPRP